MSNSYWQDRQDELYQLSVDQTEAILRREYQKVLKRVTSEFKELIDEAKAEGYSVSDQERYVAENAAYRFLKFEVKNITI